MTKTLNSSGTSPSPTPHTDAPPAKSMRKAPLVERVGWNLAGHVVFSGCNWLLLVVLAKMSGPGAMGNFILGLAIATPLFTFTKLGLRSGFISDVEGEFEFGLYLGLRLVLTVATLAAVGGILLALGRDISATAIMFCSALLCASSSLSDIFYAAPHRGDCMRSIGVSRITKGLLALAGLPVVLALTDSVALGLAGVGAAWLLHTIFYDIRIASNFETVRLAWHGDRYVLMIRLMVPMGFAACLSALAQQLPAYWIEQCHGATTLGYFSGAVAILSVVRVASLALAETAFPELARLHSAGDRPGFWRLMGKLSALVTTASAGLFVGAVLFGKVFLRLAFTTEFVAYYPELLAATATSVVLGCAGFLGVGLTAVRLFRSRMMVAGACLLVGSLVATIAVPTYGVMGGVIVLAAVSSVWVVLSGGILVATAAT